MSQYYQTLTEKEVILAALARIAGGKIEITVDALDAAAGPTRIEFDCPSGGYGSGVRFEFDRDGLLQEAVGYGD